MFVLEGGPREGQLVDELPVGYAPIAADEGSAHVILFDDFSARKARWMDRPHR
jgi:hypothetical protein